MLSRLLCGAVFAAMMVTGASASPVSDAVADTTRPAAEREQDAARKPAETLAFAGIKPGQSVADFLPGGGYFTRLFADVVGPKGHVTMLETTRWGAENVAADQKVIDEGHKNVSLDASAFGQFKLAQPVDVFWTSRNYHDLLVEKYGKVDMDAFNRHVFDSLKPGGLYVVLDHSARAGSGAADVATLHRIDEAFVKAQVEKAGFQYEGASQVLRNPADDRTKTVFDKAIQGHTDQFILKFRKPA